MGALPNWVPWAAAVAAQGGILWLTVQTLKRDVNGLGGKQREAEKLALRRHLRTIEELLTLHAGNARAVRRIARSLRDVV
jgi:hypothetical protein